MWNYLEKLKSRINVRYADQLILDLKLNVWRQLWNATKAHHTLRLVDGYTKAPELQIA